MDVKLFHEVQQTFNAGKEDYERGLFKSALQKWMKIFSQFRDAGYAEGMAEILYHVAMAQKKLGEFQDAIINLKESLELFQFIKKETRIALVLHALGAINAIISDDVLAMQYFEKALKLYEKFNDKHGIASIYFEQGNLHIKKNELEQARESFEKSLNLLSELNDELGKAKCFYSLSLLELKKNNVKASVSYLNNARLIFKEVNDIDGQIKVMLMDGIFKLKERDYVGAEKNFKECFRLIAERYIKSPDKTGISERKEEVQVLLYLGDLILHDSLFNLPDIGENLNLKSIQYFNEASELASKIHDKDGNCQALYNLGLILSQRESIDDIIESTRKLNAALEIAKELNHNEFISKILLLLSINYRKLDQYEKSLNNVQDCLVFTRKLKYNRLTIRALIEKYRILFTIGNLDKAKSVLGEIEQAVKINKENEDFIPKIYLLYAEYYKSIGDIELSNDYFTKSHTLFTKFSNKKGMIQSTIGIAELNEQQGFYIHSIMKLDDVEKLYLEMNQVKDASLIRIEKARLFYVSGNLDKSLTMIQKEIDFLQDIRMAGVKDLLIKAKLIHYRILKSKGRVIEAEKLIDEVFSYYLENENSTDLFNVLTINLYQSLQEGNSTFLKKIIKKIWLLFKNKKNNFIYKERIIYFLHILGCINQQDGDLEQAKRFLDECIYIVEELGLEREKGIILAQIANNYYLSGKSEDAITYYKNALKILGENFSLRDLMNIKAKLAMIYLENDNTNQALEEILDSTKYFEKLQILEGSSISNKMNLNELCMYYTDRIDVYFSLSEIYFSKYLYDKDPVLLKRSALALEYGKIFKQHEDYFSKTPFKIFTPTEEINPYIEKNDNSITEAKIKYSIINFLYNRKNYLLQLTRVRKLKNEYLLRNIDGLDKKINEQNKSLDELIIKIKKNRAMLMQMRDPGTYTPFLGFELFDHLFKKVTFFTDSIVLDYAVFRNVSKIVIYILKNGELEVIFQDIDETFYEVLESLSKAVMKNNDAEIIYFHKKITNYLLPTELKTFLFDEKVRYVQVCPDQLLENVIFNLLGDENN
ncbi:MAG: tetratricopeptide repeat protein, partial [Promethearchaeota archaeon]